MASIPDIPNDSSNRVLQDRFNQDIVALLKAILDEIEDIKTRLDALENP